MSWYCDMAPGHPLHGPYHESEYGFPLTDERRLFERLCLEIMQAGLSWTLVLRKRPALAAAFAGFDVDAVAAFGPQDRFRLLADTGIIRNRAKIAAVIDNARTVQGLRATGGFARWLDNHHPLSHPEWTTVFRGIFRFTGGEVVKEFLMSTGYLPGAHHDRCPVFHQIAKQRPAWTQAGNNFRWY
jgi:DNA-3-methyladenine glycosylase I